MKTGYNYYNSDSVSKINYYPGGMQMPSRNGGTTSYRYAGAGGQEKETEVTSNNSHYSAEYWMYDSRLGRRWNQDPITYPFQSPYATFNNNPILYADPLGLYGTKIGAMIGSVIHRVKGNDVDRVYQADDGEWGFVATNENNPEGIHVFGTTRTQRTQIESNKTVVNENVSQIKQNFHNDTPELSTLEKINRWFYKPPFFADELQEVHSNIVGDYESSNRWEGAHDGGNAGKMESKDWEATGELGLGMAGGPLGFILSINAASSEGVSQSVRDNSGGSSFLSVGYNRINGLDAKDVEGKNLVSTLELLDAGNGLKKTWMNVYDYPNNWKGLLDMYKDIYLDGVGAGLAGSDLYENNR